MSPMRLGLVLLPMAVACDADCDDPSRIDGDYAVWMNITAEPSGDNLEGYPAEELFYNGQSRWSLKYNPSKSAFQMSIDGQPFDGKYSQESGACNHFNLDVAGDYTTEADTVHSFAWKGTLNFYGETLGGTYNYSDDWVSNTSADSGSITIKSGELSANLGDDTGL